MTTASGEPSEPRLLKPSEASQRCGLSPTLLKQLAADGVLPQARRGPGGHVYIPEESVPTWAQCVALIEEQRDLHLRRALKLIERLERELEAVRNDIAEAREHPHQPLGVDLLAFGDWHQTHTLGGETTTAAILQQFVLERAGVESYDRALREAHLSTGSNHR